MSRQEIIKIFGDRKIRSVWDDETEIWYFSIVDVVAVLTESKDPLAYWRKLKQRLKAEGNVQRAKSPRAVGARGNSATTRLSRTRETLQPAARCLRTRKTQQSGIHELRNNFREGVVM